MMEQNRLSHFMRTAILFAVVVMLAACEKSIIDEDLQSPNSLLQIRTRAGGGDEATVSYPVQVYVFQGEECKAVQTIGDAGQTLNIALTEGTCSVYAIGGASSTDYNLLNAFCATSDEPERYAALIRALNDNIDYTRRHAMHRKQKSDDPQPDGGDKE